MTNVILMVLIFAFGITPLELALTEEGRVTPEKRTVTEPEMNRYT